MKIAPYDVLNPSDAEPLAVDEVRITDDAGHVFSVRVDEDGITLRNLGAHAEFGLAVLPQVCNAIKVQAVKP